MRRDARTTLLVGLLLCLLVSAACSNSSVPDAETAGAAVKLDSALEAHAEGLLEEAVRLYQRVLVLDPENKFAYYNLGLIDQTLGRTDAAASNYTDALTIDPDFGPALSISRSSAPSRARRTRRSTSTAGFW